VRSRIEGLDLRNGAGDAARALEKLARERSPGEADETPPQGAPPSSRRDRLAVSAQLVRRVGLRLPAIVVRRAVDRFRNPPPPPAKIAVLALGLEGEDLLAALATVSEREGVEPRRILAITDSLDFSA